MVSKYYNEVCQTILNNKGTDIFQHIETYNQIENNVIATINWSI